jgi:uncharacterized membrane protein HdeD (DUF308 family)
VSSCDYSAFSTAIYPFNVGAVIVLVGAAFGIFFLRRHGSAASWPPMIGTILLAAQLITTYAASRAALNLPLFGGRASGSR